MGQDSLGVLTSQQGESIPSEGHQFMKLGTVVQCGIPYI